MTRPLDGAVAIVTGSALNIGRAICVQLGAMGASVVSHARINREGAEATASLVRQAGGKAATWIGDLTENGAASELVAASVDQFGGLNILVNNAALRGNDAMADISIDRFQQIMRTNVEAPFLCAQAAVPEMKRSGWGRIVNMGGLSGHRAVADRTHVSTSKAALVGLTKALAGELAALGITANIVVPGLIDTIRGVSAAGAPHGGHPNVLGREGKPDEVAHIVTSLCHPNAAYTTGQTIHVNGGAYAP
ncbi:MAG: SDR family oxidoreductase [Rhodobacteraceae bacterium]|nr:SDR family oxidoreductase [Paracoccaceae bacterium]